ncbi:MULTISPECIES: GNAT family N-acetyltransferase [Aequorivita]|uniref:GNAT family N-acetyltransferase n=1 Tax=Aequorivita iocasae TaxID=2803865 RepID=A0ABX7DN67_9FLAO|nr:MULTISPECIES: GNAT family N-acetyltransferase [Aequorivita]QQX75525.1 GNAT family N-acetyltransferase [Aequorivita iocasae]UCA54979.1 GNAT family N-acetyltransferase [Aequorivita sp. F7]
MESNTFSVKKYTAEDKLLWQKFLENSKNATFLFQRDFMEYHADRFTDYSLLVFKKGKVVAALPANISENTAYSHQGLTYGGLLLQKKTKLKEVVLIFSSVLQFLNEAGIEHLHLKMLPKIYNLLPSDEMDYLLFITEAEKVRTDVLSVIDNQNPLKIAANRMEGVKKANKSELRIEEENDFEPFWEKILIPNLALRHQALPVHSFGEITELANNFPKNIIQFNVYKADEIVGGATIFETETVAHVQYISANEDKQQLGTLDFLFEYLITERFRNKRYFDFGTSNENHGKNINEGLLYWKECFGGRCIVQSFYEVKTANYKKLATVFL